MPLKAEESSLSCRISANSTCKRRTQGRQILRFPHPRYHLLLSSKVSLIWWGSLPWIHLWATHSFFSPVEVFSPETVLGSQGEQVYAPHVRSLQWKVSSRRECWSRFRHPQRLELNSTNQEIPSPQSTQIRDRGGFVSAPTRQTAPEKNPAAKPAEKTRADHRPPHFHQPLQQRLTCRQQPLNPHWVRK